VAQPKRLVCFVEGKGDRKAVPALARRVLKAIRATDVLVVDDGDPFEVDGIGKLIKTERGKLLPNWRRWLEAALRERQNVGGILLVLDGDVDRVSKDWKSYAARCKADTFCARDAAATLADDARAARAARAGEAFSVAVVFAMKEFEAWLLAGVESLRGMPLADNRVRVPRTATCPTDLHVESRRNAKALLQSAIPGYHESLDQAVLAKEVRFYPVLRKCRSFRRFWSAVRQLSNAARHGSHVVTPPLPSP